jgi:glycogen debranching enzyme GlgX
MVMDSLRYWAGEMHVDGFRFDLAPILGRGDAGFDARHAFFTAVAQDPQLAHLKLIAEPWDIGPGGYQLGAFPTGWLEWNDRFRDTMRGFWVGASDTRGALAQRLCASSDIFRRRGRLPSASVNFVVAHDGFCLRDLVSYDERHNQANGEGNRDGHGHNLNWNCGVEGPTAHDAVNALRGRIQRALLAVTVLAQGTPMLCAGDEIGHTQHGNNNAYCQDNPTSWIDWNAADADLLAFTAHVLALRHTLQPLRDAWYDGSADADGVTDLAWLDADGQPMADDDWAEHDRPVLACLVGKPGKSVVPMLLLLNGHSLEHAFVLPPGSWQVRLDSADPRGLGTRRPLRDLPFTVGARSVVVLVADAHDIPAY